MAINGKGLFLLVFAFASVALAQHQVGSRAEASALPPGVLKGVIKSGERYCAFIAGGRTVYPNDTFTTTKHGHTVTWKVIDVSLSGARVVKLSTGSSDTQHPPLEFVPNFGTLVMQLEQGSQKYSAASTRLLKDQAMEATARAGVDWCSSNQTLYVTGTLSDLAMLDDCTAQVQLRNVNLGSFSALQSPRLSVLSPFQITVPFSRERAESANAGYTVVLCGKPVFRPKSALSVDNTSSARQPLTCFSISSDGSPIGSLEMVDPICDIFDPKKETVQ